MSNRIRTGQGRVEFLANKALIYSLLEKGHTIIAVFEQLKEEGKLTLSYASFSALLRYDKATSEIKNSMSILNREKTSKDEQKNEMREEKNYHNKNSFIFTEKSKQEKF